MVTTNLRLPDEVKGLDSRPFLSCHIHGSGADAGFYVAWPRRLDALEEIDCHLKLQMELDHWLHLCLQLAEGLAEGRQGVSTHFGRQGVSAPFRDDFNDLGEAGIARTLRTLRGIEALLLGRSSFYPKIEESTKNAKDKVRRLFDSSAIISCDFDPAWNVSLLLLLVRAAAWSQTGWQQPYLWEAYSAWRARTAHERKGWLGEHGRKILTFLVRFQTAPGQYVRKTGDIRFLEAARKVAGATGIELPLLLTALGILAMAQDFRSIKLIPSSGGAAFQSPRDEERRLCGKHGYDHEPTDFALFWELVSAPDAHWEPPRKATWSYSSWLLKPLKEEQLESFQNFVEESHEKVFAFSFGRDYRSRAQKGRVTKEIRKALKSRAALRDLFTFNPIQVPDCLEAQAPLGEIPSETLMEIRLADDVTAADMVFSDCGPTKSLQQFSDAWGIYCRLFQTALDKGLILWPRSGGDSRYCPTALISRFLEAAYRLHPADCVSIPIRVNEGKSFFLHLPVVPSKTDPESGEVQAAARYVPAWVLNQIMMQEVTSCRVALEDLGETEPGRFWQTAIKKAIKENYFDILLHRYLSDYLAEPSRVLLDQGHIDLLPPLEAPSADPGSEVWALLQAIQAKEPRRSEAVILGIDIGGSFIKMRFYRLEESLAPSQKEASRLTPLGTDFRILTKASAGKTSAGKASTEKEKKKEREKEIETFVERLQKRIREEIEALKLERVDAVGVNWPGPVRQRRVQGTSGILANLGFSKDIPDNDIHEIMGMDLARRLVAENFGATSGGASPIVTLLNDGDAHALGTLAEAFLGRRLTSGVAAQLGVVVKAGTGTAGALIRYGLPAPGLMEFGKLIVDLGYIPREEPKFPGGVASLYCSRRTLPGLMTRRLPHLGTLDPPIESIEVGRLAEAGQALAAGDQRRAHGVLRQFVWDAGKIAVAWLLLKIDPELDVVALEELSRNWLKDSNAALRKKVIQYLALDGIGGRETRKEFRDRIRSYGKQRLLLLFNLDAADATTFWKLFRRNRTVAQKALTKLDPITGAALRAVDDLGRNVGDLLALLYFTHRMRYAVLGGGVLSQTSGTLACNAAVRRLNMYNEIGTHSEDLAGNLSIRFADDETPSGASLPPGPPVSKTQGPVAPPSRVPLSCFGRSAWMD